MDMMSCAFFYVLVFLATLARHGAAAGQPSFDFSKLNCKILICKNDTFDEGGVINLTKLKENSTGRVTFPEPVRLWDDGRAGWRASFTTAFSFDIRRSSLDEGDGIAFFVGPADQPPDSNGSFLGLFSNPANPGAPRPRTVAVEFDTNRNDGSDPRAPVADHIGIDVNDIVSNKTVALPPKSLNGEMSANISYNGENRMLVASWALPDGTSDTLEWTVDLKDDAGLPQDAAVGFSATTGPSTIVQSNKLLSWSFQTKGKRKVLPWYVILAICCSVVVTATTIVLALVWWLHRRSSTSWVPLTPRCTDWTSALPRQLSSDQIKKAISKKQILGSGAFGEVYLGELEGRKIAVKKLITRQANHLSAEDFGKEMGVLLKVRHKNLVKLEAYCSDGEDRFICFEYMSGGSLDKLLYASKRGKSATAGEGGINYRAAQLLDWGTRYYILKEICTGLHYLHVELDSEVKILHMDLKAGNVLIDAKLGNIVVKIGDFGISRLFKADQSHAYVENYQVIGMKAYLPPECFTKRKISEKVDIYCYGMLLLEMVTGWCATDDDFPGVAMFITKARRALSSGDVRELLDRDLLLEECSVPQVLNCFEIALDCLNEVPEQRPDTTQIAQRLRMQLPRGTT